MEGVRRSGMRSSPTSEAGSTVSSGSTIPPLDSSTLTDRPLWYDEDPAADIDSSTRAREFSATSSFGGSSRGDGLYIGRLRQLEMRRASTSNCAAGLVDLAGSRLGYVRVVSAAGVRLLAAVVDCAVLQADHVAQQARCWRLAEWCSKFAIGPPASRRREGRRWAGAKITARRRSFEPLCRDNPSISCDSRTFV